MVSMMHGFILISFAAPLFYIYPGECGDANTPYQKRMLYTAVGYFFYDFIAVCYYGLMEPATFFHHLICIIGMTLPLTYGMSANFVVRGMHAAECADPLIHSRVILRHYGLKYTQTYEVVEILFMFVYVIGRVGLYSYATWSTCVCDQNHWMVKFVAVALVVHTMYFVSIIVGIYGKRFKEISDRSRRKVKTRWFEPLNK